ncbi:hypothetical protein GCM10007857_75370 [Bradyrhizobium iriomotense]|uniref:Uncharacterized protein n=1 Tax=Bradyrhizobium iriomotense TaxID=441950 RepID=A0ABQ6BAE7_9BRAD|nr:hypothetical protein GCM10007857_75370 [Bradyrhizobium iriomotense]
MRSKSRFTTLVLLKTRESNPQIRVQSHCMLPGHCRQGPRNIRYQLAFDGGYHSSRLRARDCPIRVKIGNSLIKQKISA